MDDDRVAGPDETHQRFKWRASPIFAAGFGGEGWGHPATLADPGIPGEEAGAATRPVARRDRHVVGSRPTRAAGAPLPGRGHAAGHRLTRSRTHSWCVTVTRRLLRSTARLAVDARLIVTAAEGDPWTSSTSRRCRLST